jgi:acyl carrier protein
MEMDMEKKALEAELIKTFSSALQLDPEKVSNDCLLEELGIDSLDLVEAVFQFEEKYKISIPFNANAQAMAGAGAMRTVGDLLNTVTSLILAKRNTLVVG